MIARDKGFAVWAGSQHHRFGRDLEGLSKGRSKESPCVGKLSSRRFHDVSFCTGLFFGIENLVRFKVAVQPGFTGRK